MLVPGEHSVQTGAQCTPWTSQLQKSLAWIVLSITGHFLKHIRRVFVLGNLGSVHSLLHSHHCCTLCHIRLRKDQLCGHSISFLSLMNGQCYCYSVLLALVRIPINLNISPPKLFQLHAFSIITLAKSLSGVIF